NRLKFGSELLAPLCDDMRFVENKVSKPSLSCRSKERYPKGSHHGLGRGKDDGLRAIVNPREDPVFAVFVQPTVVSEGKQGLQPILWSGRHQRSESVFLIF